jgi:hypothetical protein
MVMRTSSGGSSRTGCAPARLPHAVARMSARRLVLLLALAACQTVGPRSLQYGRGQYNAVVQRTNGEQLLLNLVRLRYRDAPLFLDVTSISSSLSLELGAEVLGNVGADSSVGPNGRVTYNERPTITYQPLQGERFGQQFLTPIEPRMLLLLYHSGWAIDRIFKVFLQRLGPLPNAPRASGPTPEAEPLYREFFRACELLRGLWSEGLLDLDYTVYGETPVVALRIHASAADSAQVHELSRLLGLKRPRTTILLSEALRPGDPNLVPMGPRSLLASMYYASQGVEVPRGDMDAGKVTVTRSVDGRAFDWKQITGRILQVHHSRRKPADAYVTVYYRGRWWYIADDDLDSKSTFSFLSQALEMLSSGVKNAGPVLTLPIAAE